MVVDAKRIRLPWWMPLIITVVFLESCRHQSVSSLEEEKSKTDEIDLKSERSPIPDVPRRMLIKEVEWGNKKTFKAGVDTSFAGSTFAVETEISLTLRFGMGVWLFAPGTGEALIGDNSVFLGNTKDRPYNFICRFQGYLEVDPRDREKLTLFGNGLSNESYQKDTTGVVQSSESFDVEVGGSWLSVFKRCQDYAAKTQMLASVERDLRRMMKGLVYHDAQSSCVTDAHCSEWHSTVLPIIQSETVPVCQKQQNGTRFCSIAGKKNASCSLWDKKRARC